MAVLVLKGTDAEDKHQGYAAYADALIRSLEAEKQYPALTQKPHTDNVKDVKAEVAGFTNFVEKKARKSSNFYQNSRTKLDNIKGPGTALKFDFKNQRNFTQTDATQLDAHLAKIFPKLKINVGFKPNKARCVIHVGL